MKRHLFALACCLAFPAIASAAVTCYHARAYDAPRIFHGIAPVDG